MKRVHWKWLAVPAAITLVAGSALVAMAGPALADTCTVTATNGACGPYLDSGLAGNTGQNTYVDNDMWAANTGTTQTLTATSPENWSVVANAGPAGYTGVQTYPDVQQLMSSWNGSGWGGPTWGNTPVHLLSALTSSFDETMPTNSQTDAEAGYDIWVGNAPSGYSDEIMIWNQDVNRGAGGGATQLATPTIGGVDYTLYRNGGPGGELILDMSTGASSGTADLLAPLNWLIANGYEQPDMALEEIDYGWEICSTGAEDETFTMNDFSLSATVGGTSSIAPVAYASAASGVSSTHATLNGSVNPEGQDTSYQFDYGTTTSYGSSVPASPAGIGSGTTTQDETATLTGLTPGTVYHYRVAATNATGTTYGQDQSFTTPAGSGAVLDDKTFEDGTSDSLADWYGETSAVTTSQAHLGTRSLEIDSSTPFWAVSDAWPGQASVTSGKDDLFTGWLKSASGSANFTVTITWLNGSGSTVGTAQTISASDNATNWTEFAGQFTPPSGAATAYMTLSSSDGGTHYLDDLAVTQIGTVLDHKSFEDSTSDSLDDWYGETSQVTSSQAFAGSSSLEIDSTSSYWGVETTWPGQAQVTPGEDDTFFGWLKSASESGSLLVSVYYLDADGNQAGTTQTISATDNADGWTEFSAQLTAPAGAVTAYETIESNGGGTHYVDDLEVATS